METLLLAVILVQTPSPYADDRAGKLLAELLSPGPRVPLPVTDPTGPRRSSPPGQIESPEPAPPLAQGAPSRSTLGVSSRPVLPRPLPEGSPLVYFRRDPLPPQQIEFATGAPVRVASVDVAEPVALPRLSIRPVDATPAEDPTAAASTSAALSASPPQRINPAPYLRLTLPDPFEHRDAVRLPRPNNDHQPPAPVPIQLPEYKR